MKLYHVNQKYNLIQKKSFFLQPLVAKPEVLKFNNIKREHITKFGCMKLKLSVFVSSGPNIISKNFLLTLLTEFIKDVLLIFMKPVKTNLKEQNI